MSWKFEENLRITILLCCKDVDKSVDYVANKSKSRKWTMKQGRRSHVKSEGAKGGYFFSCNFLLLFWAIWKNDLFSKSQKVGGLKPGPLCPSLYAAPGFMYVIYSVGSGGYPKTRESEFSKWITINLNPKFTKICKPNQTWIRDSNNQTNWLKNPILLNSSHFI